MIHLIWHCKNNYIHNETSANIKKVYANKNNNNKLSMVFFIFFTVQVHNFKQ